MVVGAVVNLERILSLGATNINEDGGIVGSGSPFSVIPGSSSGFSGATELASCGATQVDLFICGCQKA